jgi:hypothetical protein
VRDDLRSGQQKIEWTDANVDRVRALVISNRRLGVRLMAEEGLEEKPELWPDKWILYHDNAPVHDH